jgi:2-dehydropantoate 2-reductase
VGAGAVGCFFGAKLARAGCPVIFIGRAGPNAGIDALARSGLRIDSPEFQESLRVETSKDPAAVCRADIVLICVKTIDTAAAAASLAPHLRRDSIVVSLQNGVENEATIRQALAAAGLADPPAILPAVVYVGVSMPQPGQLKHTGRGDLVVGVGNDPGRAPHVERVAQLFLRAAVPCRVSDNIEGDLWVKLVWNCAGNAVSALGRASYGVAGRLEPSQWVMTTAGDEAVAVARAAGVRLPDVDLKGMGLKLATALGSAISSTSQDVERGRRTEIDSLNGYIARRGAELGVPTPVNRTLWALVKLREATAANS